MKKFFFFLAFILFSNFSAQLSNNVKKLIVSYEKLNKKRPALNTRNYNSQRKKLEKKISTKSTKRELEDIYKGDYGYHTKSFVIQEFLQRNDKTSLIKLFKETINDKEIVLDYRNDHLTDPQMGILTLNSELFECLVADQITFEIKDSLLKEELVDFIFASSPINIQLIENIQFQIPQRQKYYEKIKKIVIEKKSERLLISVARFKNLDDVALIKSFGNDSFCAINEFPDKEFLPFLDSYVETEYNNPEYLNAVASFCNEKAKDIIIKLNLIYDSKNDKFNKDLLRHYQIVQDCRKK